LIKKLNSFSAVFFSNFWSWIRIGIQPKMLDPDEMNASLGCSSRIQVQDPDPDILPIPDPGVKKAPDPQQWYLGN
jgi:hypothetical protein